MCQCRISCDISSWYFSHNTSGFEEKQNSKRITKRFLSLFAFWSIHASRMHMCHYVSSYSNPNVLQATWNVGCFVSLIVRRCSKAVVPGTTVSRRRRKKHSPTAGCTKYIHPIAFSPRCQAYQSFSRIFQTWSIGKSTYTTSAHPHFERYMQSRQSRWFFGG